MKDSIQVLLLNSVLVLRKSITNLRGGTHVEQGWGGRTTRVRVLNVSAAGSDKFFHREAQTGGSELAYSNDQLHLLTVASSLECL